MKTNKSKWPASGSTPMVRREADCPSLQLSFAGCIFLGEARENGIAVLCILQEQRPSTEVR